MLSKKTSISKKKGLKDKFPLIFILFFFSFDSIFINFSKYLYFNKILFLKYDMLKFPLS